MGGNQSAFRGILTDEQYERACNGKNPLSTKICSLLAMRDDRGVGIKHNTGVSRKLSSLELILLGMKTHEYRSITPGNTRILCESKKDGVKRIEYVVLRQGRYKHKDYNKYTWALFEVKSIMENASNDYDIELGRMRAWHFLPPHVDAHYDRLVEHIATE